MSFNCIYYIEFLAFVLYNAVAKGLWRFVQIGTNGFDLSLEEKRY